LPIFWACERFKNSGKSNYIWWNDGKKTNKTKDKAGFAEHYFKAEVPAFAQQCRAAGASQEASRRKAPAQTRQKGSLILKANCFA
jgi:hypothetical protein